MEKLPAARIGHQSPGRIRFKLNDQRGDGEYFSSLEAELKSEFGGLSITTNPATGSLLITGESIDLEAFEDYGRKRSLFRLKRSGAGLPLAQRVAAPILSIDDKMNKISGGSLDMPGAIFLSALLFGLYELARGNFRTPPWYTAFWYAFGVYSKSYFDRSKPEPEEP